MVILVIVILALLFLAFWGIFGRFPDEWEWVSAILAGMALAVAIPSIVQKVWGCPLVRTEFERYEQDGERVLLIFLSNPPVQKGLLRILGVRRETVQSLTAEFRISEVGSGKMIIPIRHARIYSDDDPSDIGRARIVLPPTYSVGATIIIARWDIEIKKIVIPGDRLRKEIQLDAGYYQANIILFVDGIEQHITRRFVVGEKPDDLIWVNPN